MGLQQGECAGHEGPPTVFVTPQNKFLQSEVSGLTQRLLKVKSGRVKTEDSPWNKGACPLIHQPVF